MWCLIYTCFSYKQPKPGLATGTRSGSCTYIQQLNTAHTIPRASGAVGDTASDCTSDFANTPQPTLPSWTRALASRSPALSGVILSPCCNINHVNQKYPSKRHAFLAKKKNRMTRGVSPPRHPICCSHVRTASTLQPSEPRIRTGSELISRTRAL